MVSFPNPRFPSQMAHQFSTVPHADIPRSAFKRPKTVKTTFDAGYIVPISVDEILPGDSVKINMFSLVRLTTPIKPFFDNLYLDTFFFFVPNRLVWSNWEKFNGAQDNPTDSTSFLVPLIDKGTAPLNAAGWAFDSLAAYFGIPMYTPGIDHTALFHRGYNLIWNQWFRDENLNTSVSVPLNDGPDNCNLYSLLKRGKRRDYFTSCLPWPQKINDGTVVSLPLGSSAPVKTLNVSGAVPSNKFFVPVWTGGAAASQQYADNAAGLNIAQFPNASSASLYADLTSATASTINQIRQAFQLQKLFERDARGGTRYVELLLSHFGVVSPDFRLQRAEYLGGGSTAINVNPVAQTSVTAGTPLGNLAAVGTGIGSSGFSKSFVEHGMLFCFASVRADLTYQKSLDRMFTRRTRYEFYLPVLSHLGEQAVLNKEIYCDGSANDNAVFGYQERWSEYRYARSVISGKMNSHYATPLDFWHLSQKFTALPTLNATFIAEAPPIDRVSAVNSEPHFYGDFYLDQTFVRPMPMYSVPGLIDHF